MRPSGVIAWTFVSLAATTTAFVSHQPSRVAGPAATRRAVSHLAPRRPTVTVVHMGIFDVLKSAFANELFDDRRVRASHILVKTEQEALDVKKGIDDGAQTFAEAAKASSTCPSAKDGGSLGAFGPGKMVPQFDEVCFDESIEPGTVVGPVKTVFGYHLVKVEERFTNKNKSDGNPVF